MTSVQILSELQIYTDKVQYDKKEKRLTITLTDFTFVGQYKPSALIGTILDDLHASVTVFQVERSNIFLINGITMAHIPEDTKLKDALQEKEEKEEKDTKKEKEPKPEKKAKQKAAKRGKKQATAMPSPAKPPEIKEVMEFKRQITTPVKLAEDDRMDYKTKAEESYAFEEAPDEEMEMRILEPAIARKKEMAKPSLPMGPAPESAAMSAGAPPLVFHAPAGVESKDVLSHVAPPPKMKVYDINMGLQYYPVVMQKQRYLFYVHLSHKKLQIQDEEGKVVYETTFRVVTTKPEPPKLDLKVEGKGFEIHPLSGTIEVKKKTVNPPLMIFSITAKKTKVKLSKKEKKKGVTRYLHIKVDFEGKNVSHTVLAIKVQPKFFKLGPLSLSKSQALIMSLVPIFITIISFAYSVYTLFQEGNTGGSFTSAIPGGGTLILAVTFIYTLLKKGVFPMKKKVQGFLDFDKGTMMK